MGTHYHLVLPVRRTIQLSRGELKRRAALLWPRERDRPRTEEQWRRFNDRLFDLSVFMKDLQSRFARECLGRRIGGARRCTGTEKVMSYDARRRRVRPPSRVRTALPRSGCRRRLTCRWGSSPCGRRAWSAPRDPGSAPRRRPAPLVIFNNRRLWRCERPLGGDALRTDRPPDRRPGQHRRQGEPTFRPGHRRPRTKNWQRSPRGPSHRPNRR
jgi:hypothetical protein